MKITGYAGARWVPERRAIVLTPLEADIPMIEKLFAMKARRETKEGTSAFPEYTLELGARARTWNQIKAVWALITIIFRSMHGRKPDNDEKYNLYLDCLDMYADKVPNQFTGKLRPIHISEADTVSCARFIEHLMAVLVEYCDLDTDSQADVRQIFVKWAESRGQMEMDPMDCDQDGKLLSVDEWRERHTVSDASGFGGALELAHIVSRGADPTGEDKCFNFIMLTTEEHRFQHQYGWDAFLEQYPHLRSRVFRARRLLGGGNG